MASLLIFRSFGSALKVWGGLICRYGRWWKTTLVFIFRPLVEQNKFQWTQIQFGIGLPQHFRNIRQLLYTIFGSSIPPSPLVIFCNLLDTSPSKIRQLLNTFKSIWSYECKGHGLDQLLHIFREPGHSVTCCSCLPFSRSTLLQSEALHRVARLSVRLSAYLSVSDPVLYWLE